MRIERLRRDPGNEVRARVVWEDYERPEVELRFSSPSSDRTTDAAAGNPFLVAVGPAARLRGERRIRIDESLCPVLRDGMRAAMRLLSGWYGGPAEVAIEPSKGWREIPARPTRAGLFFSAGIDSLHVLWKNRRAFPADHPSSFREAVFVPYFSFPDPSPDERARDVASRQRRAVESLASRTGLSLAVVESNFGRIEPDFEFHVRQNHGAALIAAAHALAGRIGSISIATSFDGPEALEPYGSHPELDPLYSSSGLLVAHEGTDYTRLEKVRDLAGWEILKDSLMVCFEGPLPEGRLNCGECEKCLRTMTGLEIAGALGSFSAFGNAKLDAARIEAMPIGYHPRVFGYFWAPMAAALREMGRPRIARAIETKIREARALAAWLSEKDWKGRVRRFDRRVLGGRIGMLVHGWRESGRRGRG